MSVVSDYDDCHEYEYDSIMYHHPYRETKGTRYEPRKKRISNYSTKPIRGWSKIQKCRFLTDDRHLFVNSHDCYWCGNCSCSWRKCDNCKDNVGININDLPQSWFEENERQLRLIKYIMQRHYR